MGKLSLNYLMLTLYMIDLTANATPKNTITPIVSLTIVDTFVAES
jgi:hypothetical protein